MVRIPKNEQSVGYGAQMQPFSSGDGYEAPGKAQQQLGKAIQSFGGQLASLGDSFNAEADREDSHRTQLTALELDDALDRDMAEYKATADPNKWDTYAAGAAERIDRRIQEYMPKVSAQKQPQFSLHAARRRNQYMSQSREQQYGLQRQNHQARSEAGVDLIADRLSAKYPKESWNPDLAEGIYVPPDVSEIAANVAAAEDAQNAIISTYPGTAQQREALAKKATDSIAKFVTNNVPPRYQYSVFEAIDGQMRAKAPAEAPVVPGTTPQSQMHRWGGGAGQGQMPTYTPIRDFTTKPGRGFGSLEKPTHIVLHDVSGNDPERKRVPQGGNIPNYHITFDSSGVNLEVPLNKQAPHARQFNSHSIGISHIGYEGQELDEAAIRNGAKAVLMVQEKFGIPAENILTHPEGGPAATRSGGKDKREASWRGAVLSYIGANKDVLRQELAGGAGPQIASGQASGGIKGTLTAYAPQRGGDRQQGGYAASRPGPGDDPKNAKTWTVKTLEDVATGKAQYVTLAGDPSLEGKTYVIPQIAYVDKAGNQKVLENVKAVVHDTGSAFKGKPEGRFDVAVARDVDEKTRNANHAAWKKAGIEFVPEGQKAAEALPVSQRGLTRVAGLPTVNDAGPQPAGNDNARAPNTIPAEAGGEMAPSPNQAVRVADAGGGIPQSAVPGSQPRMLPSGERRPASYYNEWWREHKEAFRKNQIGAVENAVKQVEDSAKETFIHPAAEQIRKEVMNIGDPEMLARVDRAVASARIGQSLRPMRPDVVNAGVQALRSQMGPTATPEAIANLKMMEAMSSTMNTELSKDQLGWAAKAGVIPAPKLIAPETMSVDGLAERAILARQSSQNYGLPPQFFQPEEEARLKAVVEQGGKPLLVALGMMSKGFGPDMPLAVRQIAPKHPEVVQAGWLMANNLNPETAQAIVDGIARRSDPAYKADGPNDLRNKQADTIQQVLGDTFDRYPQQTRDAITRAAELVYETRNRKPREYDEKLFKTAVSEVLGQTDRGEAKYGGIYSQDRGFGSSLKPWSSSGSGGTRNIILPPHIRNDDTSVTTLKQAIATLTPSELAEAGITPPTYRDGRPMPMFKAMAGKFVQADQDGNIGRFTVAHGDPSEEATAAWVLTTPRPFEPVAQADAMGVMPPEGSTVDLVTPPWGSEKSAPLAPTQRWTLDLRPDSALSDILRRKLGRQVFR